MPFRQTILCAAFGKRPARRPRRAAGRDFGIIVFPGMGGKKRPGIFAASHLKEAARGGI